MGIFPETLIDEVRRRLKAGEVLRKIAYRPEMIQENGQAIKCFCPIHRETIFRTLLIDTQRGSYRCSNYSCPGSAGGDLIDLYARSGGLSYEQAMLELAGAFDIPVDLAAADQYLEDTLEVAQNYLELGVMAEAEEHFERILRFRENCLPALEGLLRIYQATGRDEAFQVTRLQLARAHALLDHHDQAIALLDHYLPDNPTDVETRLFYATCLQRAGSIERAAAEYAAIAELLARQGEVDRALEVYRLAEALQVVGVEVSGQIVRLLVGAGRREEALAAMLSRADACSEQGDPEGSMAALDGALELDASREDLCVRLAELVGQYHLNGGAIERVCGRVRALLASRSHGPAGLALDALERAFPSRPFIISLRADLEEARGNLDAALDLRLISVDQFQQNREYQAALATLDRAMNGRADNVTLLSRKANLLREMGRSYEAVPVYLDIVELFRQADEFENAAAVFQTVIDLQPDNIEHREQQFDLYLLLGIEPIIVQKALALTEVYRARRELYPAANLLSRALRRVPQSPELLMRHGELLEEGGRRAEAAEQFCAVGRIFLQQQALDRARQVLDRALKDVPEHLEARETLGDVLARQDQTLQAISIYTDLAEFFQREKEVEPALRLARKLLDLQPDHMPTLLLLSRAYGLAGQAEKQLATRMQLVQLHLQGQSYTRATELCEEILYVNEDYTPALEQLVAIAQSTRQGTQSVKYLWKLAQVHSRAGRREAEQSILEQILATEPLHLGASFRHLELLMLWGATRALADAISLMIQYHEQGGQTGAAIQILEDLCQTSSPKPEIFAGLARLYRATDDAEGVKQALRTQAELLGRLLRDDEALAAWDALFALQPEDMTILRTRIEILLRNNMSNEAASEYRRLATALIERRRYEEAQIALLEVLNLNPRDLAARDELISVLVKTRDFVRAAEQIEEAAGRLIEAGAYVDAIRIFGRTFEFDAARDDVHRKIVAIHQRMNDAEGSLLAINHLLDCLEAKESLTEFEQAIQEAIDLNPDDAPLRQRLAAFLVYHGRAREAEGVLLILAVRQIESAQIDAAEATLEKILETNANSVPARAHRAELMARRGLTQEALNEFINLTGSLAAAQVFTPLQHAESANAWRAGNYEGIMLIKEYTFDSFIVGTRNNFAHATAMAVCRAPAKNYNPLFLYSDVGLGKTHLCHAIAHYIGDRHPQLKVRYTTTEDFVAELIEAIQNNAIAPFRNRHRLMDVLIIDDVQFLSGKERAQEEFFHVFNAIFQAGKQIILTSDRPPKDISHLEKRLKSRFGAGIIVDIQPPDLETRLAILHHELAARGKDNALSNDVLLFIAEHIESNVRDLKGALNQLLARQEFAGNPIDVVMSRQLLDQYQLTA